MPCDFSANSCAAGETCIGDPELGTGTCSASDAACESAIDTGDGKADGTGLVHEVMGRGTGRVLRSMKLWTIAWHADAALAADIDEFHRWMLPSGYWKSSLVEYGVGAGAAVGVVEVPGAPPVFFSDDATMPETIVKQLIASGRLPAPDALTAYSFLVPAATGTPPGTGGYHSILPTLQVPYEVMTRTLTPDGSVDFDELTYAYAHETAEMATDPFVDSWGSELFFREVGDMCNNLSRRTALVAPPGGTPRSYKISRLFSNARAAAGLDPCVPVRAGAEYRGVVVSPIEASIKLGPLGNGTTRTTLLAFSSDPAVRTVRWHSEYVSADQHVSITPSEGVATIGTPVTITVTARDAQPSAYGIALDFITSLPAPNDMDWNAGEIAQWNTLIDLH